MKIAYFDCCAGAGGDMITAAMLDAGLDEKYLREQLATLGIEKLTINISETKRCGFRGVRFEPTAPQQAAHRSLEQITKLITDSCITDSAKQKAIEIFNKLAHAESTVHGKKPNDIHFHEIGAVDTIVDIVSACIGFETLGVQKVYSSNLTVGGGSVEISHGLIPVPAPATVELLKGVPIEGGPGTAELLTPTAAAILTSFICRFGPLPAMKIETIGYGAGSLDFEKLPNLLRLIVGQTVEPDAENADTICLIESNIDDITGEQIGFAIDSLLAQGALDVYCTPLIMKHNRCGTQLSVICKPCDAEKFEKLIFQQGLTFGIRRQMIERSKLSRNFVTVKTHFGEIRIKIGRLEGKIVNVKPEFADCAAAATKHNVSAKTVLNVAMMAYTEKTEKKG